MFFLKPSYASRRYTRISRPTRMRHRVRAAENSSTALRACPNISTTAQHSRSKECERTGHDTKPSDYSRGSRSPRNSQSIDVSPGSALPHTTHAFCECLKPSRDTTSQPQALSRITRMMHQTRGHPVRCHL
jgi:hypothetical protein